MKNKTKVKKAGIWQLITGFPILVLTPSVLTFILMLAVIYFSVVMVVNL